MPEATETVGGEEIPRKVIRVSNGYGQTPNVEFALFRMGSLGEQMKMENRILDTFEDMGYVVVRGGQFNANNAWEIGIDARLGDIFKGNDHARNKSISKEVGATMPRDYATPTEVLKSDSSIVAKLEGAQQGVGKYLLDTEEKKAKFLTFALLGTSISQLARKPNARDLIERLIGNVKQGDFSDELFPKDQGMFDGYNYQEFIQSPSEFNTSFRIVADAFGQVHYGLLLRSDTKKGEESLKIPNLEFDPLEEVQYPGTNIEILLTHPESPFYIEPKRIVSNYSRGGKEIVLNGQRVEDEGSRQVLKEHGLDPDNPQLSAEMVDLSTKIGSACRGDYPYVGIDFIQSNANDHISYYFLEANTSPGIDPEDLALDSNTPKEDCQIELLRRVLG